MAKDKQRDARRNLLKAEGEVELAEEGPLSAEDEDDPNRAEEIGEQAAEELRVAEKAEKDADSGVQKAKTRLQEAVTAEKEAADELSDADAAEIAAETEADRCDREYQSSIHDKHCEINEAVSDAVYGAYDNAIDEGQTPEQARERVEAEVDDILDPLRCKDWSE